MGIVSEYRLEKKYNHNILSVIFDADSFFYAISDINDHLMMACRYDLSTDNPIKISEIIQQEDLARHYYSAVNIFNKAPKFSFIPVSEYVYGMEELIARNSFDSSGINVNVNLCGDEHLHIIHGFAASFTESFQDLRPDLECRHLSLAFIQGIKTDGVHVHVEEKQMVILVRIDGKFMFYNQFKTPTVKDRVYFTMLSYDQLNLDPSHIALYMSGVSEHVAELKELLLNYVSHIKNYGLGFKNLDDSSEIMDLYFAAGCE